MSESHTYLDTAREALDGAIASSHAIPGSDGSPERCAMFSRVDAAIASAAALVAIAEALTYLATAHDIEAMEKCGEPLP